MANLPKLTFPTRAANIRCYDELKSLYGLKESESAKYQPGDNDGKFIPSRSAERHGNIMTEDEIAEEVGAISTNKENGRLFRGLCGYNEPNLVGIFEIGGVFCSVRQTGQARAFSINFVHSIATVCQAVPIGATA